MRTRLRQYSGLVVASVLAVVCLAGTAMGEQVLRVAVGVDIRTFNPHALPSGVEEGIALNVLERLVTWSGEGTPVGVLAVSWENTSPTEWVFHLRQGVKFSNGAPFNAEVAKWNLLDYCGTSPSYSSWLGSIQDVVILDESTIKIVTKGPNPELVQQLAWGSAMWPLGSSTDKEPELIGTGPYKLVRWIPDVELVFEANAQYWGATPEWDRVVVRSIPNPATRTAALLSGEIDFVAALAPQDVSLVERTSGLTTKMIPSQRIIKLMIDSSREVGGPAPGGSPGIPAGQRNPLADYRVRQAIWHALDISAITDFVLEGFAVPADQIMMPGSEGYVDGLGRLEYNPTRARQLLSEAGYANGFTVRVDYPSDTYDPNIGLTICSQLAEVGINAVANGQSWTALRPAFVASDVTLGYSGWGALTMPIMSWHGMVYGNPRTSTYGVWNSPRSDTPVLSAIIDALQTEMDPAMRREYYRLLGELNQFYVAIIPLFYTVELRGMKSTLVWTPIRAMEHTYFNDIKRTR